MREAVGDCGRNGGRPSEAAAEYQWMIARGVRFPGDNVVRDSLNPDDHSPVDLGEWLLRRELLLEMPFETEYPEEDIRLGRHEDDKFLDALVARGEPVACTHKATLKYYLGGFSTLQGGYDNPYAKER